MTKKTKIIILVLLAAAVIVLGSTVLKKYSISRESLFSAAEKHLAESISTKEETVDADEITLIASISNAKETVFVYEYGGKLMSAFAVKSVIGGRYMLTSGEVSNAGSGDAVYYDPAEPVNFRLNGCTKSELYSYQDGEFTLLSSSNRLNGDLISAVFRALAILLIVCAVLFSKTKKEA